MAKIAVALCSASGLSAQELDADEVVMLGGGILDGGLWIVGEEGRSFKIQHSKFKIRASGRGYFGRADDPASHGGAVRLEWGREERQAPIFR